MSANPSPAAYRRTLLTVDDDPGVLRQLGWLFENVGIVTAHDRPSALNAVRTHAPQVVTLDLGMPPDPDGATEGLKALEEILAIAPQTKVIVVTGNDEHDKALQAVALGAYDFYQKPVDADTLPLIVNRAFRLAELEEENRQLKANARPALAGVVTASPVMLRVCRTIEKIAPSNVSVLLLGESGTGKEVLAKALHDLARRPGPFIALNVAAIPENLLESELFGHEKGAFTGAIRQVKGKIELAHRGTLLLDEIGDMPMSLQVKILRVLQERRIERVGGRESIPVDVRIIAATHRDIDSRIKAELFREDLYYRIAEVTVDIPPLRERNEDAILLARHFVGLFAAENGRKRLRLSAEAVEALGEHPWPGNVRELVSRIKRAGILAEDGVITPTDLGLEVGQIATTARPLREVRDQAERTAVLQALEASGDNLSAAARMLAVSRPTLYDLLKTHGIRAPGTERSPQLELIGEKA